MKSNQDTAFAGYLIKRLMSGSFAVSKDGYHICYAVDMAEAIRVIKELV